MACPITVSKFVGTVSLGLLTGLSYSSSSITLPALKLLPTASSASRSVAEVKRLNRKHALRLTNLANACLCCAYSLSPPHRKHPYLVWMAASSLVGSYALDFWFHRQKGFVAWARSLVLDPAGGAASASGKKDDDLVVVEAEENVNGESVQREMDDERRLQGLRAVFSGLAFAMGIVGLWGDRK